ncbi:iron chaperone [Paenibacillus sp. MCAF20]
MDANKAAYETIDEYMAMFTPEVQAVLQQLRSVIKEAAPEAAETIGYQMPAFKHYGSLVFFAAYKKHIGFYPTSSGIPPFLEELSAYKVSKGAIQFPLGKPLPYDLIRRMVAYRVAENEQKAAEKGKKK